MFLRERLLSTTKRSFNIIAAATLGILHWNYVLAL